ncbi:MAG: ATP-binding protein [Kofleriaceae bacterium]
MTFRGRPARLAAIQDLTELRKMQASLAFADRMASVGTLAAGVAHEINNPLTFVTIGLATVSSRLERANVPDELRASLDQILRDAQDGAARVASIVRDLKVFSRADDESVGPVELAPVVQYATRMAASEIKHRARLELELGDPVYVLGNETRLGQVFLNLLINAAQAIPIGRADENLIAVRIERIADVAVISVFDTGVGIDSDLMPRIFEPFVTTKSSGTGLGLAICHGIVGRFGGTIEVSRATPQGTVFRVSLRSPSPPSRRPLRRRTSPAWRIEGKS